VPRIGVSAEFVRPGKVGGTEQALHYMIDGLAANLGDDDRLVVFGGDSASSGDARVEHVDPPRPMRVRFVQETFTYRAHAGSCDAYYFPNYFTPPVRSRCRTVTTIPDLQYLHLPENFSRTKRLWLGRAHRHTLRKADVVTVYSESVLADVAARYGEHAASRATVLPIPVSWERFGSGTNAPVPARRYVLGVSSHYKHKNLGTLVRAFKRVHEVDPDVDLVLVGQFGTNLIGVSQFEDVPALIDELGLSGVVRTTGYVTPQELGDHYRGADLFVFPSIFEGFGLPPVEALGFGLPVITTNRTSLPEVTRGLAEYVDDPFDDIELAEAILRCLSHRRCPSDEQVAELRAHYAPERIGAVLYRLLTSSG
jgi:glycosyltransferase involved in cell wall biosynthesis